MDGAMILNPMLVPILDRYAKAWPTHAEQPCPLCTRKGKPCDGPGNAEYVPLAEAFTTAWDDDAHFAAYSCPETPYRLDSDAHERHEVAITLLVVDVEPADHKRTDAWDDAEAPKIQRAIAGGAYFYSTRGGYRLLWRLERPFFIQSKHDAQEWSASYLNALDEIATYFGIVGDRTCKDWTRLYRLPFVTRDGVEQEPECTDPTAMGAWTLKHIEVAPTVARVSAIPDNADPKLIEHVRERLRAHGPAIEGKGGDQHTFVACAMVARGFGLDDATAMALLSEWNATCVPPWDESDLQTKLDNAFNYGQGEIGESAASWATEQRIKVGMERSLARQPEPNALPKPKQAMLAVPAVSGLELIRSMIDAPEPDYDTFLQSWGSLVESIGMPASYPAMYAAALDEVTAYAGAIDSTTDNIAAEKPYFMSAAQMFAKAQQAPAMLIERLVMEGGIAVISGEPKSAKTWLAIECGIAVATGGKVLGTYQARKGGVAYFFTEDMHNAITTRIAALLAGQAKTWEVLGTTFHAQPRGHHLDITRPEDCARIIASVRNIERTHGKVVLLTLDPLRNIHGLDEDKSGDMARVFECLKMIGKLLDLTIMLVHHAKKASASASSKRGGQKMRGSSAVHGFLDSGIYLDDVHVNDEATLFTNAFESEVKAARSAGKFELALAIDDDKIKHTAKTAKWLIGKHGTTNATPEQARRWQDIGFDILDALFLHSQTKSKPMGASALLDGVKGNASTKQLALDWCCTERYVQRNHAQGTYAITPKGITVAKARQGRSSAAHEEPEVLEDDQGNIDPALDAVLNGGTDHAQ